MPANGFSSPTEHHAYRRAREIERLAIDIHEVTPIRVRHVIGLIAVDHDHGRIAAALVRIAQLDAPAAHEGG